MNFGFIIDNRKCIGCHACTVACKAEHEVPLGVNRTWVKYIEKGVFPDTQRLFSVMRCNHCADAPCVEICPVTALFDRADGIVDFDPRRCIGCRACMQACPYDALYIDPNTDTAAKCNYCAHRVDIGLEPACVNVCPTHAIISGDLDNPESEIARLRSREQVSARKIEKGTRPKLFYIDGDEASLTPSEAPPNSDYMWGGQVSGVGHYASHALGRMNDAPATTASQLAGALGRIGETLTFGDEGDAVLVPVGGDGARLREKAREVARETARRTYDAPVKGAVWGWQVSAYMWTKAIGTGAFFVPAAIAWVAPGSLSEGARWFGWWMAVAFMGLTGALLTVDLDRPLRFLYVLLRPQWRSWLVRGAYIILAYTAALGIWAIGMMADSGELTRAAEIGGAALGVMTAIYTAFLFAQAKGRDFWQSPMLPVHMLVHAIIAGAAVLLISAPLRVMRIGGGIDGAGTASGGAGMEAIGARAETIPTDDLVPLVLVFAAALVLKLVADLFELFTTHATDDARRTAEMIARGRFARLYWGGVVATGVAAPLILVWKGGPIPLAAAGAFSLAGLWIAEHLWVRAPQMGALS